MPIMFALPAIPSGIMTTLPAPARSVPAGVNSTTWVDVGYAGQASNGTVSQLTINGTLNVNTAGGGGGLSVADAENAQGTVTINTGATVQLRTTDSSRWAMC